MKKDLIDKIMKEEDNLRNQVALWLFNEHDVVLPPGKSRIIDDYIDELKNPIWKPYKEDDGNVYIEANQFGKFRFIDTKGEIKPLYYSDGHWYIMVTYRKNTKHYFHLAHRIVATLFVPNPNPKDFTDVNHIDGNKWNNWYRNLEWCTHSYNIKQAYETGLRLKGEDHPNARYTNDQVRRVCELLQDRPDMKLEEIEDLTGVYWKSISDIYNGSYWTDISKEYNFPPRQTRAKGENNGSAV